MIADHKGNFGHAIDQQHEARRPGDSSSIIWGDRAREVDQHGNPHEASRDRAKMPREDTAQEGAIHNRPADVGHQVERGTEEKEVAPRDILSRRAATSLDGKRDHGSDDPEGNGEDLHDHRSEPRRSCGLRSSQQSLVPGGLGSRQGLYCRWVTDTAKEGSSCYRLRRLAD